MLHLTVGLPSHVITHCDVETSVKCLDVSHSEFNLNSINTDEAIFMDMILAPEVAPEMTRINQRMRGLNLLERLNKGNIIKHNEALHDDGAI